MNMITIELTGEQAETLGFALTVAKRNVLATADTHKRQGSKCLAGNDTERAQRIEELRVLLDLAK